MTQPTQHPRANDRDGIFAAPAKPRSPDRGIRLLRLRLAGAAQDYEVDLRAAGSHRPLSVVAGPTNTGKTSVLRFVNYCLGGSDYPDNAEVVRQVRSAIIDTTGPDGWLVLERGIGAANVTVSRRQPGTGSDPDLEARPVEPTGAPASVSQLLLATVGLQDVQLKEAPTQAASGTDPLSFRDLMWLCLFLNERIGSAQLLHETNTMKQLKLRQVVDAVFGVHDDDGADLARRLQAARGALQEARRDADRLREFVGQQQPQPVEALRADVEQTDRDIRDADADLAALDGRETAATGFAADLRSRHSTAALRAGRARALVRDRRSLVDRFASLRAQYADDVRKLTLLAEAASVFDQLSVTVCPACLSALDVSPAVVAGRCTLCAHDVAAKSAEDGTDPEAGAAVVKSELRATKRRYEELTAFWQGLDAELAQLVESSEAADAAESAAAAAVDRAASGLITPYAAEREAVLARRQAALVLRDRAAGGIRLWEGVAQRDALAAELAMRVEQLRAQGVGRADRPGREQVIGKISARYAAVLREIGYPKIDQEGEPGPFIDDRLVPHARGRSHREASSGGQVLISLAWILAVFETAYEEQAAHPGFLMIDTPSKNLGGKADDSEFSDSALIDRFYRHVIRWLEGPGVGAQVVIVDNTPPDFVAPHVVVRYTRDPDQPPFGLIDNETG